jgi:hypothetical protein
VAFVACRFFINHFIGKGMLLIDRWLNGKRNFIVGRVLYDVFGNDKGIKDLLRKGNTAFSGARLLQALQQLNAKPVTVVHEVAEATMFMPMPAGTDDVLIGLENEWKPSYVRMNFLRHKLDEYNERNDDEARTACAALCKEILQLEKDVMQVWNKRNYYAEHGKLPFVQDVKDDMPGDPLKLAFYIENIKKNIRRNRKLMNEPGADAKYAQLYGQWKDKYFMAVGEEYKEGK